MSNEIRVHSQYRYLIKSTAVESLQQAQYTNKGIHRDRHWTIVKEGEDDIYKFISIDKYRKIITITARIEGKNLKVAFNNEREEIAIPITDDGRRYKVDIYGNISEEIDDGDLIAEALSDFLGVNCRLVHMPEDSPSFKNGQPRENPDSYQLNLCFLESFNQVNDWIEEEGDLPVALDQYRMNLVLEGGEPFIEDEIAKLRIGEVEIDLYGKRARCSKTTVDQHGNTTGKQPMKALYHHRREGKEVYFGEKATNITSGVIYNGQSVEILAYK